MHTLRAQPNSLSKVFRESFQLFLGNPSLLIYFCLLTIIPLLGLFPLAWVNQAIAPYGREFYYLLSILLTWPIAFLYNLVLTALFIHSNNIKNHKNTSVLKTFKHTITNFSGTLCQWSIASSAFFVFNGILIAHTNSFLLVIAVILTNFFLLFIPLFIALKYKNLKESVFLSAHFVSQHATQLIKIFIFYIVGMSCILGVYTLISAQVIQPLFMPLEVEVSAYDDHYFMIKSIFNIGFVAIIVLGWHFFAMVKFMFFKQIETDK